MQKAIGTFDAGGLEVGEDDDDGMHIVRYAVKWVDTYETSY